MKIFFKLFIGIIFYLTTINKGFCKIDNYVYPDNIECDSILLDTICINDSVNLFKFTNLNVNRGKIKFIYYLKNCTSDTIEISLVGGGYYYPSWSKTILTPKEVSKIIYTVQTSGRNYLNISMPIKYNKYYNKDKKYLIMGKLIGIIK